MHVTSADEANSKFERDGLLLADKGEDFIEIVAMENDNHTADLPRRNQKVSRDWLVKQGAKCKSILKILQNILLNFLLQCSWHPTKLNRKV